MFGISQVSNFQGIYFCGFEESWQRGQSSVPALCPNAALSEADSFHKCGVTVGSPTFVADFYQINLASLSYLSFCPHFCKLCACHASHGNILNTKTSFYSAASFTFPDAPSQLLSLAVCLFWSLKIYLYILLKMEYAGGFWYCCYCCCCSLLLFYDLHKKKCRFIQPCSWGRTQHELWKLLAVVRIEVEII